MIGHNRALRFLLVLTLVLVLGGSSGWNVAKAEGKIDINTATVAQLTHLNGIGPAIAKRIVNYRSENGEFTNPDQLLEVRGIGPKTLEKISERIMVSEPSG